VVLSGDIFAMPAEQIEKVRVHLTIFNGSVIYRDPQMP
jgi:predicted amidohydrolase YtcJ